jgi:hypothetical protein
MSERKKLSDILQQNADRDTLASLWKTTAAAAEFAPLPIGEYTFRIVAGELSASKRGTPGYKLTLEVTEGEFEGRCVWHDFWLTPAALPMTKRDLAKIGVQNLEQLEQPLPPGILLKGKLGLKTEDDGTERNRLTRFEFIGIEKGDAFEPTDEGGAVSAGDGGQLNRQRQTGNTAPDTSFPFGANAGPSVDGVSKPPEGTP